MALPTFAELTALLRHRRSIKPADLDTQRPVEKALLLELLENATWAPTHGLTEPWRFFVFEREARLRLSEVLQDVYRKTTPVDEFREDKLEKMGRNPALSAAVIGVVMERRGGAKIPELEEFAAVACAVQNLMLSATAAGLGCYWSSPPLLETKDFKEWLGICAEDRCVGLIYLGWPKPGFMWPRSVRQPVENKITWNHA